MELKREQKNLQDEKAKIEELLGSEKVQWKTVAAEIKEVRKTFGPDTALGKRRTTFAEAPDTSDIDFAEAMIEREPITVIVSEKGWVRAMKGHQEDISSVQFKGDDKLKTAFFAETTSKIIVVANNGRFFTLDASKLSSRLTRRSSRAVAASAIRSASWSIWKRARISSLPSLIRQARSCSWRVPMDAALSCPPTR
jgi:DNA gyrase/topoisomerase IV subunit A